MTNDDSDPIGQLAKLGEEYRHVREEQEREAPRSASRRRLQREMKRLAERFERSLEHWVYDEELREAWRRYLHHGASRPSEPHLSTPPVFRGRAATGVSIEVRAAADGGYDLLVDGVLAEHHDIPWHRAPDLIEPIQVGDWTCHETFAAPDAAVSALQAFLVRPGASPPWNWARELYEDGMTDRNFALTPRGARRLAMEGSSAAPGGERANFCVLLANAGRARVLTLASKGPQTEPTLSHLEEVSDLTNPEMRARDSEQLSDTRPGLRREGPHGPRHAVSDRREAHHRETERRFFERVADEAAHIWAQFRTCTIVVVAGPQVRGLLRPAIARRIRGKAPYDVVEFSADLTRLAAAAVHDALARPGILPPSERLPPMKPMRTPNPWQGG